MASTSNGKDSTARVSDASSPGGVGSTTTGGSIEDVARNRQLGDERGNDPGGIEAGAGGVDRRARSASAADTPETELGRRIRRMFLISARSEYRLLAQPQRVAFRDMGRRLVTEHDDPNVVRGMLDVAQHKGWERVNLAGSETFRRLAWLEARARGLETIGYVPSREDRQRLADWLAERSDAVKHNPGDMGNTGAQAGVMAARRASAGDERAAGLARQGNGQEKGGAKGRVDADTVVLAVAEAVLRERKVGEETRSRVLAAISRRLAVLRERAGVSTVRVVDPRASSPDHGAGSGQIRPAMTRER